jgi:hypothetical protein
VLLIRVYPRESAAKISSSRNVSANVRKLASFVEPDFVRVNIYRH